MKQKTPLFDLKEDLIQCIETGSDALNDIKNLPIRNACKEVLEITLNTIIKRIDEELLPKEKEVIKDAFIAGDKTDCFIEQNIHEFATDYFNKTFTQKQTLGKFANYGEQEKKSVASRDFRFGKNKNYQRVYVFKK